jgi:putative protease
VGEVLSVRGTSFTARISRRIHRGDRLRLQDASGGEASAFLVMEMRKHSRSVTRAEEGDTVTLFTPFEAEAGSRLYKVGESRKKTGRDPSALPLMRSSSAVDVSVRLDREGISVTAAGKSRHYGIEPEPAKKRAIDGDMLQDLFRASRSDDYRLGSFTAEIDGEWFVPPAVLKKVRRTFWEELIQELAAAADYDSAAREDPETIFHRRYSEACSRLKAPAADAPAADAAAADPAEGIRTVYIDDAFSGQEALLPIYVPETAMEGFTRSLADALERGVRRFRISSLFQFRPLFEEVRKQNLDRRDIFVTASWPLPAANSFSADLLGGLGADRVQAWIELDREGERLLIDSSGVEVEQFVSGRIPLLVTRAEVAVDGTIVDSRGRSFYTAAPGPYGVTVLWSGEGYQAEAVTGFSARFSGDLLPGYGNPGPGTGEPALFNRDREWK